MKDKLNIYELTRNWFDFCFENPELINPNHSALYFFILSHCNRLGWKEKFGLPTSMAKEAVGMRSYKTYIKTLNDLVDFKFIVMLEKSKNQYSSNIIGIVKKTDPNANALDIAVITHESNHCESNSETKDSIDIPDNNTTKPKDNNEQSFLIFWDKYQKKTEGKKCKDKFLKLHPEEVLKILEVVDAYVASTPEVKYRKNPLTWLNGRCWEDEIINTSSSRSPSAKLTDEQKREHEKIPL